MNEKYYHMANPLNKLIGRFKKSVIRARYYNNYHRLPDLKNPKTWYEKIFWMVCNCDMSKWGRLADKYAVRDYVKQQWGDDILNDLYGVYKTTDEIDYANLPEQFILKTNNGCASNVIVRDKSKLDINETNRKLNRWLKLRLGNLTGQPHYMLITPCIIAERLLIQDGDPTVSLTDYKFYCFNGEPRFVSMFANRREGTHSADRNLYDMDWKSHPELFNENNPSLRLTELPKPKNFEKMIEVAKALSVGFPYVRVDLYNIEGKVIFGEMTFTPGMDGDYKDETHLMLGDMIDLSLAPRLPQRWE